MSMNCCALCNAGSKVVDTRNIKSYVRRRYECTNGHRFTTVEVFIGENAFPNDIRRLVKSATTGELSTHLEGVHAPG